MSVHGKTLRFVGLGNTGEALAKLAVPFGLRVVAVKRSADAALARNSVLHARYDRAVASASLRIGFLSLHLPQTVETVDIIGARELEQMKQGAFLINISRAPMLNRQALLDALRSGHLGGAD